MKLGVDARMMHGIWKHRGIGRYTKAILQPLKNNDVIAFLPKMQSIDAYQTISKGFDVFPWWEQKVLPQLAKKQHVNYLLCPSITSPVSSIANVRKIVIIYDLIFMESFSDLPASHSLYNNLGRLYRRFVAPKGYKTADILISISEYSRDELERRFGIAKNKVLVIPCSIPNDWWAEKPIPAAERERYLLTVSGDAPSKNLPILFEAFSKIVADDKYKDFKLKIVGVAPKSRSHFIAIIDKLNISENVVFEGFLNNDELKQAYRRAWASLTLSLYEGFGIPIVEAMASGTPVVCSNTTSMPEVGGDAAILADPRSIGNIVNALTKIMSASGAERDQMALDSMAWSRKFSEETVSKLITDFWTTLK